MRESNPRLRRRNGIDNLAILDFRHFLSAPSTALSKNYYPLSNSLKRFMNVLSEVSGSLTEVVQIEDSTFVWTSRDDNTH